VDNLVKGRDKRMALWSPPVTHRSWQFRRSWTA